MSVYNNNVTLIGNLGKPAEIVETKAGTVAKFSIAVYRNGKGEEANRAYGEWRAYEIVLNAAEFGFLEKEGE